MNYSEGDLIGNITVAQINREFPEYLNAYVFNRYDDKGNKLCRNPECSNHTKRPYRFYCSSKCKEIWERDYYDTCCGIRKYAIAERDNYRCRICDIGVQKYYEIDHIKPRSVIKRQIVEQFDKIPEHQKDKRYNEFVIKYLLEANNPKNLRTLCGKCHKKVTAEFLQKLGQRRTRKSLSYQLWLQGHLEDALIWFNGILRITSLEHFLIKSKGHLEMSDWGPMARRSL